MENIIKHPHYVCITKKKKKMPKSSHGKPINTILKDKLNIVQNYQLVVKTKPNPKTNI